MAVHNPEQPKKICTIYFFKLICTSSRNMISARYVGMVIHVDYLLFLKTWCLSSYGANVKVTPSSVTVSSTTVMLILDLYLQSCSPRMQNFTKAAHFILFCIIFQVIRLCHSNSRYYTESRKYELLPLKMKIILLPLLCKLYFVSKYLKYGNKIYL